MRPTLGHARLLFSSGTADILKKCDTLPGQPPPLFRASSEPTPSIKKNGVHYNPWEPPDTWEAPKPKFIEPITIDDSEETEQDNKEICDNNSDTEKAVQTDLHAFNTVSTRILGA